MITDDEYLERLVAGIQMATMDNAQVTWNEKINGRQFDVVVRFKLGTLRYLVLIEVKNRKRKASAEDLDAFVTKARDQTANKAVFVNVAGFQKGAIKVAQKHGIDLFTVTFDATEVGVSEDTNHLVVFNPLLPPNADPQIEIGEPEPIMNVTSVTFLYSDKIRYRLPDERSQLSYYISRTTFDDGSPIDSVFETHSFKPVEIGKEQKETIRFWRSKRIIPPDDYFFPAGKLKAIECTTTLVESRKITGNILMEPTMFRSPVVYTNVLTGIAETYTLDQLPIGVDEVKPGNYYFQFHPLRYFYCEGINDGIVEWILIESFQNRELITSSYTQKVRYSVHYIPVADKKIISRLEKRLADYRRREKPYGILGYTQTKS